MAASLAWSADYRAGIETLAKSVALFAIFIALRHALDRQLAQWMALAVTVGLIAIIGIERTGFAGAWGGYHNHNFQTEALLLGLPFVAYLHANLPRGPLRLVPVALIVGAIAYLVLINPSKIEFLSAAALAVYLLAEKGWQQRHRAAVAAALWRRAHRPAGRLRPLLLGQAAAGRLGVQDFAVPALRVAGQHPDHVVGETAVRARHRQLQRPLPDLPGRALRLALKNVEVGMFAIKQMQAGAAHNEFAEFLAAFGLAGVNRRLGRARGLAPGRGRNGRPGAARQPVRARALPRQRPGGVSVPEPGHRAAGGGRPPGCCTRPRRTRPNSFHPPAMSTGAAACSPWAASRR